MSTIIADMIPAEAALSWTYRVDDSDISMVMGLKRDGQICLHHTCLADAPQHTVVWVCPAGHRKVNWYCPKHCQEMMQMLMSKSYHGVCCEQCQPHTFMTPLTEG